MGEFDLIKTYFAPLSGPEGLGLLDDAACFSPDPGFDLVLTKDTMVEGVHFPMGAFGGNVASRLMRVNLSDLAAKGAVPRGYLLSVAWPISHSVSLDQRCKSFAQGLRAEQDRFGFDLYGGDTVSIDGPMVVSATFIGKVPTGAMVKRSGAQSGDDVWVTGSLGQAGLGLKVIEGDVAVMNVNAHIRTRWLEKYWYPQPRLSFAGLLRDMATASVDISDGILADLNHIASASGVSMDIEVDNIPLDSDVRNWLAQQTKNPLMPLIAFGDDYEVAFTANPNQRPDILEIAKSKGVEVTLIGRCRSGEGVTCIDKSGARTVPAQMGFKHF